MASTIEVNDLPPHKEEWGLVRLDSFELPKLPPPPNPGIIGCIIHLALYLDSSDNFLLTFSRKWASQLVLYV